MDKNVIGKTSFYKLGGASTYSGITYRRHGLETRVVSNVAPEDARLLDILRRENIFVLNGRSARTTHFVNVVEGDDLRQELPFTADPIGDHQIHEIIARGDMLHLGPLHPADIEDRALKRLNRPEAFIVLDVQGYLRRPINKIVYPGVSRQLARALAAARVVKANEGELNLIQDFYKTQLAALMERFQIEEFIVTLGKQGGVVRAIRNGETRYEAAPIQSLSDPTGAGDVFLAAYVISRFWQSKNIPDACAYAAKLAARQIEGNYIKPEQLGLSPPGSSG
ncbi:MAG: hypothetical protein JSW39_19090 [Desulfobacterales bacterium]|nr:MAG: hypothetical protein JSW39_19090 [Desulfobacterales bacterium]